MTWLFGLPSSSSHALFGGLIGSAIAALGVSRREVGRRADLDRHPRDRRPDRGLSGRRGRYPAGVHHRDQGAGPGARRGFPVGSDRIGLAGLPRPRHQRRPEDHGRDHARVDRLWKLDQYRLDPLLGQDCLRSGHRCRHLRRRLARDPDAGQGAGRDRLAAGHGRRDLLGRDHPVLQPSRHGTLHHPRGHWVHPRLRDRAARRRGALGRGRPHGDRLADHAAGGRRDRVPSAGSSPT